MHLKSGSESTQTTSLIMQGWTRILHVSLRYTGSWLPRNPTAERSALGQLLWSSHSFQPQSTVHLLLVGREPTLLKIYILQKKRTQ